MWSSVATRSPSRATTSSVAAASFDGARVRDGGARCGTVEGVARKKAGRDGGLVARLPRWSAREWDAYRRAWQSAGVIASQDIQEAKQAAPTSDRPWSEKEVCRFVGRSRATIRRWAQHDGFPKPRPIGPNSVAWSEREVRAWWERKKAMRRGEG